MRERFIYQRQARIQIHILFMGNGVVCGRTLGTRIRLLEFVMRSRAPQCIDSFRRRDLEDHLSMYTLAANVAGVTLLALTPPAAAKIIYTKAHKEILLNTILKLDLNHDGIADFILSDYYKIRGGSITYAHLSADPKAGNEVVGHVDRVAYASALQSGVRVGPKHQFLQGKGLMAASSNFGALGPGTCTGPWCNVTNRYLGLKFVISGQVHYGWARLNVSASRTRVTGLLTGYAYETVANRSIFTGQTKGHVDESVIAGGQLSNARARLQTAGLGHLAQGVAGLTGQGRRQ